MRAMNLQQLAQDVGGTRHGKNVSFKALSTDTRAIKKGQLFVALSGERYDANDFVGTAKQNGAIAALLSRESDVDLPCVTVPDTLQALTELAKMEREKSVISLVAITGSNGKTTVKEMLKSVLEQSRVVLATEGNLNNHIGVPLTLLKLTDEHQVAVVEMGASAHGEIRHLCEIAKPDVVILNNAGAAHLEGFGSLQGVAEAKGEIISGLSEEGTAVLNRTEPWYEYWLGLAGQRRVLSYGWTAQADVWVDEKTVQSDLLDGQFRTTFTLHYQQQSQKLSLNLIGRHNVLNAMAAASAALSMDVSLQQIKSGLSLLQPVKGRMQPLAGIHQSTIVHDGYNANPKSFEAALTCILPLKRSVWLVLGDFAELGDEAVSIHKQLGVDIAKSEVQRLFAVGEFMAKAVEAVGASSKKVIAEHYQTKSALIAAVKKDLAPGILVLVKGSRSQGLEEVVNGLISQEGGLCC